ncbi:UNVERIFIED_CONTAM: hypothetical protein FKN15_000076 [Acipenser sinensis]
MVLFVASWGISGLEKMLPVTHEVLHYLAHFLLDFHEQEQKFSVSLSSSGEMSSVDCPGTFEGNSAAGRGQQSSNNRLSVMAVTRGGLPDFNEWGRRDPTDGQSGAGREPRAT